MAVASIDKYIITTLNLNWPAHCNTCLIEITKTKYPDNTSSLDTKTKYPDNTSSLDSHSICWTKCLSMKTT